MSGKRKTSSQKKEKHQEDWNQDIAKIIKQMYGSHIKQDSKANKLISSNLEVIFTKIVGKIKENNPVNPTIEDIGKAIKEVMSPTLATLAISEATRETFLWGVIPFNFVPRSKKLREDEKVRKMIANLLKKDKLELNRSLITGVTAVAKDCHPDARIDKESKDLVCLLLDNISDEMVEKIKESNPEELTVEGVQAVTRAILPDDMYRHATSEGNKMMLRFESRGHQFVPGSSTLQKIQELTSAREEGEESHTTVEASGVEFKNGIRSILKETQPMANIDTKVVRKICQQLDGLFYLIFQQIGDKKGIKTHEDMHLAIQSILPPLMAQHAAAEGYKMMRQQERGHIGFGRASQWTDDVSKGTNLELDPGVLTITKEAYPLAKLHQVAQNRMSFDLKRIFDAVIDKIKGFGIHDVSPADVQQAVEVFFGQSNLADHAKSEGGKWVALAEMGEVKFLPNKNRRLRRLWRVAERAALDAETF